jgi:hypothetical protein
MAQTNLMRADELANAFNSVAERKYWRAAVAGTRVNPEVHFNSRATMVRVTYRVSSNDFTVSFSKSAVAFGDFLASSYRALAQVLTSLKAAGLPFAAPVDDIALLRLEYDPRTKAAVVFMARTGDEWAEAAALAFKVPQRNIPENSLPAIDGL